MQKVNAAKERLLSHLLWGTNGASYFADLITEFGELLRFGIVTTFNIPEELVTIHPLPPETTRFVDMAKEEAVDRCLSIKTLATKTDSKSDQPKFASYMYSSSTNNDYKPLTECDCDEDPNALLLYCELPHPSVVPRLFVKASLPGAIYVSRPGCDGVVPEGKDIAYRIPRLPIESPGHRLANLRAIFDITHHLTSNLDSISHVPLDSYKKDKRISHKDAISKGSKDFALLLDHVEGTTKKNAEATTDKKKKGEENKAGPAKELDQISKIYKVRIQTYLPLVTELPNTKTGVSSSHGVLVNFKYELKSIDDLLEDGAWKEASNLTATKVGENKLGSSFGVDIKLEERPNLEAKYRDYHIAVGFYFVFLSNVLMCAAEEYMDTEGALKKDQIKQESHIGVARSRTFKFLVHDSKRSNQRIDIGDITKHTSWLAELGSIVAAEGFGEAYKEEQFRRKTVVLESREQYVRAVREMFNHGCEDTLKGLLSNKITSIPKEKRPICFQPVAGEFGGPAGLAAFLRSTLYFPRIASTVHYAYTGFTEPHKNLIELPQYYITRIVESFIDYSRPNHSALLVPIFGKGQLIGIANIYKEHRSIFSVDEIEAAESIACNLGERIQEARDASFVAASCSDIDHTSWDRIITQLDRLLSTINRFNSESLDLSEEDFKNEFETMEKYYRNAFKRLPYVINVQIVDNIIVRNRRLRILPSFTIDSSKCVECSSSTCLRIEETVKTRIFKQENGMVRICLPGSIGGTSFRLYHSAEFKMVEGWNDFEYHKSKIELFLDYIATAIGAIEFNHEEGLAINHKIESEFRDRLANLLDMANEAGVRSRSDVHEIVKFASSADKDIDKVRSPYGAITGPFFLEERKQAIWNEKMGVDNIEKIWEDKQLYMKLLNVWKNETKGEDGQVASIDTFRANIGKSI